MKNLIIVAAGDESLHRNWGVGDYDVFVVYYGDKKEKFQHASKYFHCAKGTKFKLVDELVSKYRDVLDKYDAIFIPDDDLYMKNATINRFFKLFHEYNLQIAQPSIIGWGSLQCTLHQPNTILRFTNWVEIMCPCFSKEAFFSCAWSFNQNNSNWGIERLWNKILNEPKDKLAIIDCVIAIHTRPCFFGDTYWLNGNTFESAMQDDQDIVNKYQVSREIIEHSRIEDTCFNKRKSEDRIYPDVDGFKEFCTSLRSQRQFI